MYIIYSVETTTLQIHSPAVFALVSICVSVSTQLLIIFIQKLFKQCMDGITANWLQQDQIIPQRFNNYVYDCTGYFFNLLTIKQKVTKMLAIKLVNKISQTTNTFFSQRFTKQSSSSKMPFITPQGMVIQLQK